MQHPYVIGMLLLMMVASAALAQEHSNIGVLTCTSGGTEGKAQTMTCGFKPTAGGEGRYAGTIGGSAPQPEGKRVLVWSVLAPANAKVSPNRLSQRFSGGTKGDAKSGALVGEADPSIVLLPETSAGEEGNTITQLELKLLATPV
jgi:Protein of unknown function (DUF992)